MGDYPTLHLDTSDRKRAPFYSKNSNISSLLNLIIITNITNSIVYCEVEPDSLSLSLVLGLLNIKKKKSSKVIKRKMSMIMVIMLNSDKNNSNRDFNIYNY